MRDAAVTAIDKCCVFEGKTDPKCVEEMMKALAGKEYGLVKPVSRPGLLEWATKRFPDLKVLTIRRSASKMS